MDLQQLRLFVAAAQERHLTRAAERLHISQPAASAQIKALERALDLDLFVRTPRGLELTPAGERLLVKAREVLSLAESLKVEARDIAGRVQGHLELGCNSDPRLSRLGDVVSDLAAAHPLVSIRVQTRSSASSIQGLRLGEIDAAFVLAAKPPQDVVAQVLDGAVRFRICGPASWRSAIEQADWAALVRLPWITSSSGNAYAAMLDGLVSRHGGGRPRSTVVSDSDSAIRALIESGVGVSLVRADQAEAARKAGTMAMHSGFEATAQLVFVHARGRASDPLICALGASVERAWRGAAA